jgi:hypothetical protein
MINEILDSLNEGDIIKLRTKRQRFKGIVLWYKVGILYFKTFNDKYYLVDKREIVKIEKVGGNNGQ